MLCKISFVSGKRFPEKKHQPNDMVAIYTLMAHLSLYWLKGKKDTIFICVSAASKRKTAAKHFQPSYCVARIQWCRFVEFKYSAWTHITFYAVDAWKARLLCLLFDSHSIRINSSEVPLSIHTRAHLFTPWHFEFASMYLFIWKKCRTKLLVYCRKEFKPRRRIFIFPYFLRWHISAGLYHQNEWNPDKIVTRDTKLLRLSITRRREWSE